MEPANRREFTTDILALVNAAYAPPAELTPDKFKETTKKFNSFKQYTFTVGEKYVHVYLYAPKKDAAKTDPYEVAMIFEYPSSEHNNLSGKIELCLESFAVGNKAQSAFSGGVGEPAAGPAAPRGQAPSDRNEPRVTRRFIARQAAPGSWAEDADRPGGGDVGDAARHA